MAMNKKEQAERQELLEQIARLKAWRLTQPVERDLAPPRASGELSRGWDFNAHNNRVFKACSSCTSHGDGWERTSSQNSRRLFSTPERAYAALRYAVEQECITRLVGVDSAIASLKEAA
jgi:hypothetical protein